MHDTAIHAAAWIVSTLRASFYSLRRQYYESRMISALQSLSDMQLKDIGVYRCEIPHIARTQYAAPGKP